MRQVECKVHRDMQATRQWCVGSSAPGPTLETRSGQGMLVEWANELPTSHFLPIDHHIHGAEADKPNVRTVIHLHGSRVPADGDGYPENWFVPGKSATYYYYCVIKRELHKKDNPGVAAAELWQWFVEGWR